MGTPAAGFAGALAAVAGAVAGVVAGVVAAGFELAAGTAGLAVAGLAVAGLAVDEDPDAGLAESGDDLVASDFGGVRSSLIDHTPHLPDYHRTEHHRSAPSVP